MGILELAKPVIVICTRDRARSTAFYRDTLGLVMTSEDNFASVFDVAGPRCVSDGAEVTPHEHTILGFNVPDVAAVVRALRERGMTFNVYKSFHQDELGILTLPGGVVHVAWFQDPDGNVLSVTDA